MASDSCSYIAWIHFFPFCLGHQVRHNYQGAPDLLLQQNKLGFLFSLHPHLRFAMLFFFWLREPWDFPDVVAVDRSDMGSSFSGLYTILCPSPARVETPETTRTY